MNSNLSVWIVTTLALGFALAMQPDQPLLRTLGLALLFGSFLGAGWATLKGDP